MRIFTALAALTASFALTSAFPIIGKRTDGKIAPKVFIISMFPPEADIWYTNSHDPNGIGNLLALNITVPGFSPIFPAAHCVSDGSICQLTTGESEINAASTILSLVLSPLFDLSKTYFLIGGIAGVNPKYGTLGSVAFSRYAIQVALQYEVDPRELPANFTTGYWPQGTTFRTQYPNAGHTYGTEVFEVNTALRDIAFDFVAASIAGGGKLNDSAAAVKYRANYAADNYGASVDAGGQPIYQAATQPPGLLKCDSATSDVYYSGVLLGETFENTTKLFTNGSGVYCMSAQEDNATLEALLRGALFGLVDFGRAIIMRTASDFDREYPGEPALVNVVYSNVGGFTPAIQNIYIAGVPIIKGLIAEWDCGREFNRGVNATNYIGDIFGSLGGTPDFGLGSVSGGKKVVPQTVVVHKREVEGRNVAVRARRRV